MSGVIGDILSKAQGRPRVHEANRTGEVEMTTMERIYCFCTSQTL